MNKLKELSLRLHAVSVMRDLLEDKVIKALMNFLDREGDDAHFNDTMQELLSLSERFAIP